jgi:hypothetical protein
MLDLIHDIPGEEFDRPSYHADRRRTEREIPGVVWKLERAQEFREPDDPSWRALVQGRWRDAINLHEKDRDYARAERRRNRENSVELRRLRIVERPVTAYLQWETYFFKILVEEGFELRMLDAAHVRELEHSRPLPELLVHGDQMLYEVRYDKQGTPCGARRIDDPNVVAPVHDEIAALWARGEPLMDYFEREIAPMPPPNLTPAR